MEVVLAEHAGFCFGVKRAVETAFHAAKTGKNEGRPVFTYGSIIHNESVASRLVEDGAKEINTIEEILALPENAELIIRSHGVGKDVYDACERKGLSLIDATCPFVNRIHDIVAKQSQVGDVILIIGKPGHAEVEGTIGWSKTSPFVIDSKEDIAALPKEISKKNITVVAQTTYSLKKFEELVEILQQLDYNITVCKTICNATEERQGEAEELAKQCDAMIVIGGKSSSNTQKLFDICQKQCRNTYYIQTLDDLDFSVFESTSKVGIAAGASTPNYIIEEVLNRMSEESFAQMLENEQPTNIRPGQVVEGKVIQVKPDQLVVNINYKSEGIVTASEYSSTPVDLTTEVKEGDPITVKVVKINDGEGQVVLSRKRVAQEKVNKELEEAFNNKTVLTGKVVRILSGGLQVSVDDARVFIPASLVSDGFVRDFSSYMDQEIQFVITEYNPQKHRIIGNRKQLVEAEKAEKAAELFSNIHEGDVVEGTVKNITNFGAFIDLGGADGLLHISEMSWGRVDHPDKLFKVGDHVKCFIKEIHGEKIALSCKFDDANPWNGADEKYAVGKVVTGKVARMTEFGAFVNLEPGIDALLHVSQISKDHIEKPSDVLKQGQEVTAEVVDLKIPEQKISISIKRYEARQNGEAVAEDAGSEE